MLPKVQCVLAIYLVFAAIPRFEAYVRLATTRSIIAAETSHAPAAQPARSTGPWLWQGSRKTAIGSGRPRASRLLGATHQLMRPGERPLPHHAPPLAHGDRG
jgi:hypothetical protein